MPPNPKPCEVCGQDFPPVHSRQVTCSAACGKERLRQKGACRWRAHREQITRQRQAKEASLSPEEREARKRRAAQAAARYRERRAERRRDLERAWRQGRNEESIRDQLTLLQTALAERLESPQPPKACLVCGKPVVGMTLHARCCSRECRRLRIRQTARQREGIQRPVCAVCGGMAPLDASWPSGNHLCSQECRREQKRRYQRDLRKRRKGEG